MNWKDFLKSDRNNIAVFLFLLLLSFITNLYMIFLVFTIGIEYWLSNLLPLSFAIIFFPIFLLISITLALFCLYFISCSIAWVYKRNRKWFLVIIVVLMSTLVILGLSLWDDYCKENKVSFFDYLGSNLIGGECQGLVTTSQVSLEDICINGGGTVKTQLCCNYITDFPDTCESDYCVCPLEESHEIKICDCGENCWSWNNSKCIKHPNPCWHKTSCVNNS